MRKRKVSEEECLIKMRQIMLERTPRALERLYELLDSEDLSPSGTLSVIKEILERAIGKGVLPAAIGETAGETAAGKEFELVLKVEK